ncbi:MAG: hypothetical protein NUV54_00560 [Candidatus Taylorbacteria bacterium]|nr:hypothetical protein [Candidatus Taylorbacteria bacterium]
MYRFSPIKSEDELRKAIEYTHRACFELCKKILGKYLTVAGNIGIFCHDEDEYTVLTDIRKKLTIETDNWNQKYFRLHDPIVMPEVDGVPGAVYTYLYIRKPDEHAEVGDVDFVLGNGEYMELKDSLLQGTKRKGVEIFDRPGIELLRLSDPDFDVLSFAGPKNMEENLKENN